MQMEGKRFARKRAYCEIREQADEPFDDADARLPSRWLVYSSGAPYLIEGDSGSREDSSALIRVHPRFLCSLPLFSLRIRLCPSPPEHLRVSKAAACCVAAKCRSSSLLGPTTRLVRIVAIC